MSTDEAAQQTTRLQANPWPRTFLWLWLGQMVSGFGSELSGFGLGVSLLVREGSTSLYGLTILATAMPRILAAPLAGVFVDRYDRRLVLLVEQCVGGICALLLAALCWKGNLAPVWILFLLAIQAFFAAAHFQAFSATTALLVSPQQLGRANGLVQLGHAIIQIGAPAMAGAMLAKFGLASVLVVDVASFVFGALVLLVLRLPRPTRTAPVHVARGSVLGEMGYGWRFLRQRPGLMRFLLMAAGTNFVFGMLQVLFTPLVLSFADTRVLGAVLSIGGLGMVVGSGFMLVGGGPRHKLRGVLLFCFLQGVALILGALRPSALVVTAGAFGVLFTLPVIAACNESIWQRKVPPDVQGRVFSFRSVVGGGTQPLAYLVAGPLADRVFAPLLLPGGALAATVGQILGVGPGRGLALLLVVLGGFMMTIVLAAALSPALRRLESDLPDVLDDVGSNPIAPAE
jgi:MFS family permease